MIETISEGLSYYFRELSHFISYHLYNMTPQKYGYILIVVFIFGWLNLRNLKK